MPPTKLPMTRLLPVLSRLVQAAFRASAVSLLNLLAGGPMLRFALITASLALASNPTFADDGKDESGKWHKQRHVERHFDRGWPLKDFDHRHHDHHDAVFVPKGHLPPPGECRVW